MYLHQCWHSDRGSISQIVDPVLCRAFLFVSTSCTLACSFKRSNTPLDNVIYICEVPGKIHLVMSFVYSYWFALQNIPCEGEISHVRPSLWSIYSEKSQTCDRESIYMIVCVSDFLPCFLCSCIEAGRLICSIYLRKGAPYHLGHRLN